MLFDDLTLDEKSLVGEIGKIQKYEDGDLVIQENEAGESIFVVLSGRLDVQKVIAPGRSKTLRAFSAGEFFGEMSFLDHAPRSASIVANGKCEVMELGAKDFQKLTGTHPVIAAKVYKNMARELTERLRINNEELKKALLWAIEGWTYGGP